MPKSNLVGAGLSNSTLGLFDILSNSLSGFSILRFKSLKLRFGEKVIGDVF